jgi:dolichol-phosphate mannosyltransferase
LVVVDDNSPDGTADVADRLSQTFPIRVIRRRGKQGLATAVLAGFEASSGDIIGVMDADLSHPPEAVPELVRAVLEGAMVAVGSRYVPGGGVKDWPRWRRFSSWFANLLAKPIVGVHDATSGLFFGRREHLVDTPIGATGFKIGLEYYVRTPRRGIIEVPYVFTDRAFGTSKFGSVEIAKYFAQLIRLSRVRRG